MKHFEKNPPSLRNRYILLTVLIGLFVTMLVSYSYRNLVNTKDAVNAAYDGLLQEQTHIEEVRNTLLIINKDINLFILDPLNENLIQKIATNTQNALTSLDALSHSNHPFHQDLSTFSIKASQNVNQLKTEIERLVEYRLDINKQYPGLDISANMMENLQDSIKSGFEILILEIESGSLNLKNPEIYPLLLKSQTIWINAISQTRIYMANRLASFSAEILNDQGKSLKDIHTIFTSALKHLQNLYTKEDSFEAENILNSALIDSQSWYEDFVNLRKISESDEWRSDTLIIKTRVFPIVELISQDILDMEKIIQLEKMNTDEALKKSDEAFNKLIFAIIALFLLFIAAILVSMQWMLFSPIERVTLALRSKAFDIDLPNIHSSNTREVGRLIDAFVEMDKEVSLRQSALEHQAMHDHLTGLPNRFLLSQRIEYHLLNAEKRQCPFALFLMDLDFFKDINDTLGHAAGDQLLIEVSKRMKGLVQKSDTLARLGGDEFAILLPDATKDLAIELAEKLIQSIIQPVEVNGQKVNIGISIGMVNYPEDATDMESLFQFADMAMYTAKRKRIGHTFYDASQNIYSKTRLNLIHDVAEALEQDQFEIYFQPKINALNGNICGAEGLLRWNHREYGFISPERVVEGAERAGFIHKLSLSMLNKAICECCQWHQAGYPISVSVNLSVRDLSNLELTDEVKLIMDEYQLDYGFLTLEITESVMMENLAVSMEVLNKLHNLGIHISIDDFGTGFSSLAYLKRLPVTELKIDKSFIMEMNEDANDRKIVSSTINLGHNLGLKVVAEGIETQKVMELLKEMGCDQMQGYFIGKPMTPEAFRYFLKNHSNA